MNAFFFSKKIVNFEKLNNYSKPKKAKIKKMSQC